jgi:hypothetical protein
MNEINSGAGVLPLISAIAFALVGLIAWFYVNRASVRASEQIRLLEARLEEQRKQNLMLQRLGERAREQGENTAEKPQDEDFTRLIPER